MKRIVFPGTAFEALRSAMLSFADETCSVLLAQPAGDRAIVIERYPAPDSAYDHRDPIASTLNPDFIVPIVREARDRGLSVIFSHTHPGPSHPPRFSPVDDQGEKHLADFLKRRVPDTDHFALLLAPGGCAARFLGAGAPVEVQEVRETVRLWFGNDNDDTAGVEWDRQVRAFGSLGQARLRQLRVAIVGCGGTGSVVAQQLAHLGVGHLTLIDPDVIETTNLNRVVGASQEDVSSSKVEVAAAMIERIGIAVSVTAVQGDVRDSAIARLLTNVDAIISCTDSHSSRAVINQIAYQYVIPAFDVGVAIGAAREVVSYIAGRAQMLSPGLACLVCSNTLDAAQIRRELQSDAELAQDRYIVGHSEPQPAVISINSTMSSLLVTMFLSAFTGVPVSARLQLYDGLQGRVRAATQRPAPGCIVCSPSGALSKAGLWPLPTRDQA